MGRPDDPAYEIGPPASEAVIALCGVLLFAALAAWMVEAARSAGADAGPEVTMIFLALCAFLVARAAGSTGSWELPLGIAGGGVAVALLGGETLLENTASPLGYANATAAFFVLVTAAALIVAERSPVRPVRMAAGILALAFAVIPVGIGSRAGTLFVLLLPLGFLARLGRHVARRLIIGGLAAVTAVVALSAWWGASYEPLDARGQFERSALTTISERRVLLWSDAVKMIGEDPLRGGGPGSFAQTSPMALADEDARWAHSAYLQMGAEAGLPGLALILGIVAWGFAQLYTSRLDTGAAIAAMALTGAAIHAAVDYVWEFPVVPLTAVLLVAVGSARGRRA